MSFTKFVFFGSIGKTRWTPWSLDDIFSTSLKPVKGIQQNVIGVTESQMAALASDWLRLLLRNR